MSKPEKKYHGLYLELDGLFDTRLATIELMDSEKVDGVLTNGYFTRIRNEFHGIDSELFKTAYALRNVETLKRSKPTKMLMEINELINIELVKALAVGGLPVVSMIFLNIYPYKLSDEEINEFVMAIKHITSNKLGVKVISAPMKALPPSYMDVNFSLAYLSDWNAWLTEQAVHLTQERLMEVNIVGQRIFPITEAEARKQIKEIEDKQREEGLTITPMEYDDTDKVFEQIERYANMLCQFDFDDEGLFNQWFPNPDEDTLA